MKKKIYSCTDFKSRYVIKTNNKLYYSKKLIPLKHEKYFFIHNIFNLLKSSVLILYFFIMLTYASVNTFLTFAVLFKEADSADIYALNKR